MGLGTGGTKVYVGNDDTSFATPIRVPEIKERNEGDGIKVIGQVTLDSEGTEEGHAVTRATLMAVLMRLRRRYRAMRRNL